MLTPLRSARAMLVLLALLALLAPAPIPLAYGDEDPPKPGDPKPGQPEPGNSGGRPRGGPRGGFPGMRRKSPLLKALDKNGDGALTADEIKLAHKSLLTLDKNGDGNLTSEELAPLFKNFKPPPGGPRGPGGRGPGGPPGMGGMMMRMDPLLKALDKDADSELFEDEVVEAAASLARLDRNGDGRIEGDELRPRFGGRPRGMRGPRGRDVPREGGPVLPKDLDPKDGVASVPDREAFRALSYQGDEVLVDTHLTGAEYVKFQIEEARTEPPRLYFMNTKTHRGHPMFMRAMGLARGGEGQMRGVLVYWPLLKTPSGGQGLYTFEFEPHDAYSFEMVKIAYDLLVTHSALLKGHLSYRLLERAKKKYETEPEKYARAKLPVFETEDRFADISFLPLHRGQAFGRLRVMKSGERPGPRDIVLCRTLPNEMPRVAGIITAVRQTPLSHVNLRAIQDDVPNAYIADIENDSHVSGLIGDYVFYEVAADGWHLRSATAAEVESHFAAMRPTELQVPLRDLSVTSIRAFSVLGFADAKSIGVKAANLAQLRKLSLPAGLVPDGYAVPFHYYDAFMRHNGLYEMAVRMLATADFQRDASTRERSLKKFRKAIKKGTFPDPLRGALAQVQGQFSAETSIRCRSSTNNEDLPGFSGAGLYDSYTHHPQEGHLAKSIKQVYASLWNFRAHEERSFYRIDHLHTAMGVVLHPNTAGEIANGVAVTKDVVYQTEAQIGPRFYVNAQLGENLVTNPGMGDIPEELLISPRNPRTDRVLRRSSGVKDDAAVLGAEELLTLRRALRVIDASFRSLYGVNQDDEFAMEVEFKVTRAGALLIKQARPWVFR